MWARKEADIGAAGTRDIEASHPGRTRRIERRTPFSNLVGVCCGLLPNGHSISAPKSIDFKKKPRASTASRSIR